MSTTQTAEQEKAELKGIVKNLTEKVKALESPDYSRVHKNLGDEPTLSFIEETDEVVNLNVGTAKDARNGSYRHLRKQCNRVLKNSGYAAWGEFKTFNDFVRSGLDGHKSQQFADRVRGHYKAIQGMSEQVGADGGFSVMPEFNNTIIDRVYSNSLFGMTDNYSVSGNNMTFQANAEVSRATGSRHGGLQAYWLGEGSTITSSKPTVREVTVRLAKVGVVVYLTEELISDSGMALQQYVSRKVAEELNFMVGDALINGTGVGQPLGVLSFPSLVSVAKEAGQAAATVLSENLIKMYSRFFAPNVPRARWFYNQDVMPQLQQLSLAVGTGGHLTYMPPGGLSSAPYGTLQGIPMTPTEFNATLGTQGDMILADMSQILSISKGGVAQAVSTHVEFLSDQTALRFTMRLNATPWETSPITPYKGTATQSNFVVLDTRS